MNPALSPSIVMVSSPSFPYDVREMRSESRPHALNASRTSTSSPRRGEHFLRAPSQTLVSHPDGDRIVARNRDGVIAIFSLRRRGDEIRVTAARSQRAPSIDFLSAAGRALPPRLLARFTERIRTTACSSRPTMFRMSPCKTSVWKARTKCLPRRGEDVDTRDALRARGRDSYLISPTS